ncbi:MAG: 4Fe-4S dicluster domain-containing protein [Candidatus Binatia bacterium]
MTEKPIDRKTFLRKAPLAIARAFAQAVREAHPTIPKSSLPLLRPPGGAAKETFLDLCCGTGACADVCPAKAIQLRPREDTPSLRAPVIIPNEAACVVCDELACMSACPSGALVPVPREKIRIGFARVNTETCVAWTGTDPGCNYCVARCPLGTPAISIDKKADGKGPVVKDACIGCGVCEYYCPTQPPAIRVLAREQG